MASKVKLSLNKLAMKKVRQLTVESKALRVQVLARKGKPTIIDCGIEVPGSLEAGRLVAEICMGGLGSVVLTTMMLNGHNFPATQVITDAPALSCLGAQAAGWNIKVGDFFALGSGPARACALVEDKLFEHLKYADSHTEAVLILETRKIPGPDVCKHIADACKIKLENLYLIVAPTASIVGSVQIAARIVETGIHKLKMLGFDPNKVLSGLGICPIVPVARKDVRAMGLTNDAILQMGQTFFFIQSAEDDDIAALTRNVPSSTSSAYGKPFHQIFKDAGGDFYKIDSMLFAPAQITISDLRTGILHTAGKPDPVLFLKSIESTLA
ncbi:MAG: methenyltetrahydromethanopterin cyclohydrolase [Promethearchaeota archaeon]